MILKQNKHKLIHAGFDCDIYEINSQYVYKHYPKCKLGYAQFKRQAPIKFLKSIKNNNIEKIIDHDRNGFVTHKINKTAGNYLNYTLNSNKKIQKQAYQNISKFLETHSHNDLTPDNIGFHKKIGIIIFDWSQEGESPYFDFLQDENTLINWKRVIDHPGKWFIDSNYLMTISYVLKSTINFIVKTGQMNIIDHIKNICKQDQQITIKRITKLIKNYEDVLLDNIKETKKWTL